MATSNANQHQADQRALVALLLTELRPQLMVLNPGAALSLPEFIEYATILVQEYSLASAAIAADFYEQERDRAGIVDRFMPPIPDPPPTEQIEAAISQATRDLRIAEETPAEVVDTKVSGAAQRLVTDTGRRTLTEAVTADTRAVGWARVPTGESTCAFCAMLCTRGAVYKSRATAGRMANARFVGDGEFKFHDNDDCTITPIFEGQDYEPPEQIRAWEQLYETSTAQVSGAEKRLAFRRAFEAR